MLFLIDGVDFDAGGDFEQGAARVCAAACVRQTAGRSCARFVANACVGPSYELFAVRV